MPVSARKGKVLTHFFSTFYIQSKPFKPMKKNRDKVKDINNTNIVGNK